MQNTNIYILSKIKLYIMYGNLTGLHIRGTFFREINYHEYNGKGNT